MKYQFLWALTLIATLPFASLHALQQDAQGVYQIATPQDLLDFATMVNNGSNDANARLTANLDMTGIAYIPIGNTSATRYQGTFDGQGYYIDNLVINTGIDNEGQGIFGYVENATIQNLIAGPGNKVYGRAFVGGIVGDKVSSGTATLRGCGHEGSVICSEQNGASMVGCVHAGNLIIDRCYNTGHVQGGRESAIFCGWFSGSSSSISNSYNSGTLDKGVDGNNYLWRSSPDVTNVYDIQARQNTIRFTRSELQSGALAWKLNGNSPNGIYRQNLDEEPDDHPTTSQQHAIVYACGTLQCNGTAVAGTTLTYANTQQATYLPHHFNEGLCDVCMLVDEEYLYPDQQGYYQISTPYALRWFAEYMAADPSRASLCARLTADINMSKISFSGLGSAAAPYKGEFDGGGHTITNLTIKRTGQNNVGFVNVAYPDAWIHDFTLGSGCSIAGYRYVGGFVGKVDGQNGDEIHLERLGFEGTINVNDNGGAIIGCVPNNNIRAYLKSCYSTGTITGSSDNGAISGWSSYARLTNCYVRVRGQGFQTDADIVRGFTPIFRNCYSYNAKQKGEGLSTFTLTDMQNGALLEKLADPAYSQSEVDANPKLRSTR